MEKITLIIKADDNGRYKTVDVLKQIKATCKAIVFPEKDINTTMLSELQCNGKTCINGVTRGIEGTFDNSIMEYMKRNMTLIFA